MQKQELSGFLLLALFFKNKWFILSCVFLTAIGISIYAFNLPNQYTATVNLVPPKVQAVGLDGAVSAIGSSLKELGLTKLAGGKGGDYYSFLVILYSRTVADSIINKYQLAKHYDMEDARRSDVFNTLMENIEITYETDGNYTISVTDTDPQKAVAMTKDYVLFANRLAEKINSAEMNFYLNYLDKRSNHIDSIINETEMELVKYSEKTGILAPEEQAQVYLSAISDIKSELLKQEIIYDMMTAKYGENDNSTISQKELISSLKGRLEKAETSPGLAGNFSMQDASQKGVHFLKLYAKYETYSKLKMFLTPMVEDAKINKNKEIRQLYIVDEPIVPDKKSKPKRTLIIAGAMFGSFIIAYLIVLLIYSYRIFSLKYKEMYKNETAQ